MNRQIKTIWLITALISVLVLNLNAQSFFDRVTTKSGDKKKEPTVITSDSMDFDITKNVAVFTGNVQVDDANMRILCHKMIIRFEGQAKDIKSIAGEDTKKKKKDRNGQEE
jgi:lipopolysaccharide export system protein LptA